MEYPIIADYDGEVLLLKDENDISRIEPVDVESGSCRFWNAKGYRIDASVNGCRHIKLFGLSFLTSIDMSRARIVFTERQNSMPDIKGLHELLSNGALMETDELKMFIVDICSKSDSVAPAIGENDNGFLRSLSQSEQSESKCGCNSKENCIRRRKKYWLLLCGILMVVLTVVWSCNVHVKHKSLTIEDDSQECLGVISQKRMPNINSLTVPVDNIRRVSPVVVNPQAQISLQTFALHNPEVDISRLASDKNQVMDELLNQPQIPSDYGETMMKLYRDRKQDVLTRDFAVQHIGLYAQALNRRGEYDAASAESQKLRLALFDAAGETRTIVAAAAFRALSDMSAFDSRIDAGRLDSLLARCAADLSAAPAARAMAVQLCGERRIASSRMALEEITADESAPEILRRSARHSISLLDEGGSR